MRAFWITLVLSVLVTPTQSSRSTHHNPQTSHPAAALRTAKEEAFSAYEASDWPRAIAAFERAITLGGGVSGSLHRHLADTVRLDRVAKEPAAIGVAFAAALPHYAEAARRNPDDSGAVAMVRFAHECNASGRALESIRAVPTLATEVFDHLDRHSVPKRLDDPTALQPGEVHTPTHGVPGNTAALDNRRQLCPLPSRDTPEVRLGPGQAHDLVKWDHLAAHKLAAHGVVTFRGLLGAEIPRSESALAATGRDTSPAFVSSRASRSRRAVALNDSTVQRVVTGLQRRLAPFWQRVLVDRGVQRLDVAECGLLVSSRGAPGQHWHPDTRTATSPATTLKIQVQLQDTTADMAPLETDAPSPCGGRTHLHAPVEAGTVTVYDASTLHRGTNHTGTSDRRVLFLTLMDPAFPPPVGLPFTINAADLGTAIFVNSTAGDGIEQPGDMVDSDLGGSPTSRLPATPKCGGGGGGGHSVTQLVHPHQVAPPSAVSDTGGGNGVIDAVFAAKADDHIPWLWHGGPSAASTASTTTTSARGPTASPLPPSRPYTLRPHPNPPLRHGPRFLYYEPFGGVGNQLFYLIAAMDMARALNRVLIVPPVSPHHVDREVATQRHELIPWARLLDFSRLNQAHAAVGWHSGDAALREQFGRSIDPDGSAAPSWRQWSEATPPTCNFNETRWHNDHPRVHRLRCREAQVLNIRCCLMWGWRLDPDAEHTLWSALRFHPSIVSTATRLATEALGATWNAIHVRRGDKVGHSWYAKWAELTAAEVAAMMRSQGLDPSLPVYVATDEHNHSWFAPVEEAGYRLHFATALPEANLALELGAYPPALWQDVLGVFEMIICIHARRFVGTLPSTFSGVIHNLRLGRTHTKPPDILDQRGSRGSSHSNARSTAFPVDTDAVDVSTHSGAHVFGGRRSEPHNPPHPTLRHISGESDHTLPKDAAVYFRKLKPTCCDEATVLTMPRRITKEACELFDFPAPEALC